MQSTYFTSRDKDYDRSEDTRFQCRHIFPDGHRCGSPCLRSEELCYYHHTTRRPIQDAAARKARLGTFEFPGPDQLADRSGILHAIALVLERIASNDLDPRRAGERLPAPAEPVRLKRIENRQPLLVRAAGRDSHAARVGGRVVRA